MTPDEAVALSKIVLVIEGAKQKDAQLALKFKKNKQIAKDAWDKLSEEQKAQKKALGLEYSEDKFKAQSKWVRHERRSLRYKIFRIREGKWENNVELAALKSWYEKQLEDDWSFNDFTFKWDLSLADPLKVITPYEWDGNVVEFPGGGGKFCDPAAFTKQEV
jgi:hypothetical protein